MLSRAYKSAGFGCDSDSESFMNSCRVKLYPNLWNTWLLYRVNKDVPSNLAEELRVVLKDWELAEASIFETNILNFAFIDNLQVSIGNVEELGNRKQLESISSCSIQPNLMDAGGRPPIPVIIKFIWRHDSKIDMPWFSYRLLGVFGEPLFASYCDKDATWFLDSTYGPSRADKPIPKSMPPFRAPEDLPIPDVNILGDVGGSISKAVFWGLFGGMLLYGFSKGRK